MPETATRGKARPGAGEGRSEATLPALRVRYYRQMKPQRVYTVEVSWQKTEKPPRGEGKEVTVRLIAAGAQVLPAEQTMDAAKPDVKAVFFVTPLVKGWLRNEKLEVLYQGRKVQEIPMATKVVSQRATWFLLLLTFLVPWFLTEHVKFSSLGESTLNSQGRAVYRPVAKEVRQHIQDNVPKTPDSLKGTVVDKAIVETESLIADGYQHLIAISRLEPIAFYVGVVFFTLTVISAYLHKPKRRRAGGKPIPAPVNRVIEEEDEG
jgi:hypothetical protein